MVPEMRDDLKTPSKIRRQVEMVVSRLSSMEDEEFISGELASVSSYLLKRPGKLLRPTLVFLGADYMGVRDLDTYVGLASSIELLHVSSLIHDDIIDKDVTRRGVPATHIKYGVEGGILGGNALIAKAVQTANEYGKEVVGAISESAMRMCAGEMIDYGYQRSGEVPTLKEYLGVAELKSSSLIGLSTSVVALHLSDSDAQKLYQFGISLGTAFQIRDDMIDFLSAKEKGPGYRLNVVRCMEKGEDLDEHGALLKAAGLNQRYVKDAVSKLGSGKNASLFREYAGLVEVDMNKLRAMNKL